MKVNTKHSGTYVNDGISSLNPGHYKYTIKVQGGGSVELSDKDVDNLISNAIVSRHGRSSATNEGVKVSCHVMWLRPVEGVEEARKAFLDSIK